MCESSRREGSNMLIDIGLGQERYVLDVFEGSG